MVAWFALPSRLRTWRRLSKVPAGGSEGGKIFFGELRSKAGESGGSKMQGCQGLPMRKMHMSLNG